MLRYIINVIPLCTLLLLASCKDTIDVEFNDGPEYTVISGIITDENKNHEIRINRSTPITSTDTPAGIGGATVKVTDSEGVVYIFREAEEIGVYRSTEEFSGKVGLTYTVEIDMDSDGDGNIETFTATDTMIEGVTAKRMKLQEYKFMAKKFVLVLLWGNLPEGDNNFGYCLNIKIGAEGKKEQYNDILLLSDELTNKTKLDSIPFFYIDATEEKEKYKFYAGNTIQVNILSPSKQYYDFIRYTNDNMSSDIPIYGGPPANSPSNIRQTVGRKVLITGFFAACAKSAISLVIDEEIAN